MEKSMILLSIILLILLCGMVLDKNKKIENLEFDIELLKGIIKSYKEQYDFLKNKIITMNNYNKVNNNHQILEAVKYAMKKSHPDNGGNAEDFKKFRDLYNSMKWGNYEESIQN